MRYLVTSTFGKPFLTERVNINYEDEGVVIYDLVKMRYTNGRKWNNIVSFG